MDKNKLRTHKGTNNRRRCEELGKEYGLSVSGYNPGGGTKVRVHEGTGKDWFDSHAIFATSGQVGDWAKCLIFLEGYGHGLAATRPLTPDTAEDIIE